MRTTIAKVTPTPERDAFRWTIDGTVVARGHHTADAPTGCVQSMVVYASTYRDIFGSVAKAEALLASGTSLTRKLRLTTLGYDRDDRVIS